MTTTPEPPTLPSSRFLLFKGEDHGWVLRDNLQQRDFPFYSREAARLGALARADTLTTELLGSPASLNVYGPPLESVEELA